MDRRVARRGPGRRRVGGRARGGARRRGRSRASRRRCAPRGGTARPGSTARGTDLRAGASTLRRRRGPRGRTDRCAAVARCRDRPGDRGVAGLARAQAGGASASTRANGRRAARRADRHETGTLRCGDVPHRGRAGGAPFHAPGRADAGRRWATIRTPSSRSRGCARGRARVRRWPSRPGGSRPASKPREMRIGRRGGAPGRRSRVRRPDSGERRCWPPVASSCAADRGPAKRCSSTDPATTTGRTPKANSRGWNPSKMRRVERYSRRPAGAARSAPSSPSITYDDASGRPKRVRYWAMRPDRDDGFSSGREVDEIRWTPAADAARILSYPRDVETLRAALVLDTPLYVVRHAKAGSRRDWPGNDDDRPITAKGRQAGGASDRTPRTRRHPSRGVEPVAALCPDGGAAGGRPVAARRAARCASRGRRPGRGAGLRSRPRRPHRALHARQHRRGPRPRGGCGPAPDRLVWLEEGLDVGPRARRRTTGRRAVRPAAAGSDGVATCGVPSSTSAARRSSCSSPTRRRRVRSRTSCAIG